MNPYSNLLKIKKTLVTEVPSVLKADLHYSKCKEIYISTFNILANYWYWVLGITGITGIGHWYWESRTDTESIMTFTHAAI